MRHVRFGVVLGTVALLVLGLAGPAAAKTVSPKKYAKSLCTTLGDLVDSQNELVDTYNAVPVDDPATFQSQTVELVNGFVADLEVAAAKLKKLRPDVDGGKKIAKVFNEYLTGQATEVQAAADTFAAADANGVAFAADVAVLEVAINLLSTTAGDPFSEVTNQDLLAAFDETKSCEDIVTVF
ncbi:MAG TPA: hypothetical protein VMQ81_10790 [Acidimicrobiia bacterium]|nr:hypothetical protein [Acidimicrobiia bacterium]